MKTQFFLIDKSIALFFVVIFFSGSGVKGQVCSSTPLNISINNTPATCIGGGAVTLTILNGVPPYTYEWYPNAGTTNSASNLAPGTYTVNVKDQDCHIYQSKDWVFNGDFSAGNVGFSSQYIYCNTPLCLIPEGMYAVGSDPTIYHNNFFGNDHTTGVGYFMIVNGSKGPNVNVWCQTIPNVVPNTNYVFSAWVCTLNDIGPPELQFSANGAALGSVFAGPTTVLEGWKRFCAVWNSGTSASAYVCILNQSTALDGNDFGLDDISFRLCSPTTVTFTVSSSSGISIAASTTNVSCKGGNNGTATITPSGGVPGYTYSWSNGQTSHIATRLSAGSYSITVQDAAGCMEMKIVNIIETAPLSVTLAVTNASSCTVDDGQVSVAVSGGTPPFTYLWNTGGTTADLSALGQGTYTLSLADANGCVQTNTAVVTCLTDIAPLLQQTGIIIYPNPNHGVVYISCPENTSEILVTDIFGRVIYHLIHPVIGKPVSMDLSDTPPGIYFLKIKTEAGMAVKKIIKE